MAFALIFAILFILSLIRSLKRVHSSTSRRGGGSAWPATTEKGTVIATTGTAASWPLPSIARASPLCATGARTPQASPAVRGGASVSSSATTRSKRVCCLSTRKSRPGQRSPAVWSGGTYDDVHGRVTSVTMACIMCARTGASSRATQRPLARALSGHTARLRPVVAPPTHRSSQTLPLDARLAAATEAARELRHTA
mgnify:CR=1 FL=1